MFVLARGCVPKAIGLLLVLKVVTKEFPRLSGLRIEWQEQGTRWTSVFSWDIRGPQGASESQRHQDSTEPSDGVRFIRWDEKCLLTLELPRCCLLTHS